ncbi:MAG: hypothetical protein WA061_02695 [Microgenomates group bacterium]
MFVFLAILFAVFCILRYYENDIVVFIYSEHPDFEFPSWMGVDKQKLEEYFHPKPPMATGNLKTLTTKELREKEYKSLWK